jgi:DNA-binding CsgD family transcriptional regulator/tetratricopeptide (TPR) repeat protein
LEPLREAFALLPVDADPRLRARVLEELARRLMLGGNMAEGNETARLAIAAALDAGSSSVEANARTTLGVGLLALGSEDEGLAEFERACSLTRENTRTALRFYINYSDGLHLAGRYADALDQALRGVQVARDLGLERSLGAMLAGNAAEPLIALGEWDRASSMINRALELEPPMHHQAHLRLLNAWLSVWRGELEVADATLLDFRPMIGGDQPSPQYASFAIRTDAEHALAAGDLVRAWFDMEGFLDHAEIYNRAFAYEMLAIGAAAARALDQQEGKQWRTALVRDFYSHRAHPVAIRRLWEPVIDAELSDSQTGWRSAVAALRQLPAPAHLAPYAGLRLAQHLVAGHHRTEAKDVIATAQGQASSLGAGLLSGRLAALAQRAGLTGSTAARSPIGSLTPREVEVLGLVAAGRSNGEIGSTLFISTKTASVHVSNILAKLGVNGRGEAAAVAHRAGLSGPG